MVVGSNPTGPSSQHPERKPLKKTDKAGTKPEKQNLVSGLFFDLENDPDLKLVLECWPKLSFELKQAIIKMGR